MKSLPKISIVIPSYNKVKFIRRTLESIFSQEYKNLEVIIQDGGSSDGTLDLIKYFSKKYPKVLSFESKKDGGQLDAINKGISKATGDIVSFINADDCYCKGALAAVSNAYILNPSSIWFAGLGKVVNENDIEIAKPVTLYKSVLFKLNSYSLLITTNYLMQPSVFITLEAFNKYGPFSGTSNFVMEYDMWLKMGCIKMPILINKPISQFRIEPSTKTKTMFASLLAEDEKIVKKYTNNPVLLMLHKLNNLGRVVIGRFV